MYIITVIASIIGNCLVILAIWRKPSLRTIPNWFIFSMAISDILIPVIGGSLSFLAVVEGEWKFGAVLCNLEGAVIICSGIVSVQMLNLLALNRYFCIVHNKWYRKIFTRGKTKAFIATTWFFAALFPLQHVAISRLRGFEFHPGKVICFETSKRVGLVLESLTVALPFGFVLFAYSSILRFLKNHNRTVFQGADQSTNTSQIARVNVVEVKLSKTIFITVLCFEICWVPIFIIDVLEKVNGNYRLPRLVYVFYTQLGLVATLINALVRLTNNDFRAEFVKILKFKKAT